MALTCVTFCKVGINRFGTTMPIIDGETAVSASITPSGSNQQTSASTQSFAVVATDTQIYVAIGADPDATSSGTRFLLPANAIMAFQIEVGNKVAVATPA